MMKPTENSSDRMVNPIGDAFDRMLDPTEDTYDQIVSPTKDTFDHFDPTESLTRYTGDPYRICRPQARGRRGRQRRGRSAPQCRRRRCHH